MRKDQRREGGKEKGAEEVRTSSVDHLSFKIIITFLSQLSTLQMHLSVSCWFSLENQARIYHDRCICKLPSTNSTKKHTF